MTTWEILAWIVGIPAGALGVIESAIRLRRLGITMKDSRRAKARNRWLSILRGRRAALAQVTLSDQ